MHRPMGRAALLILLCFIIALPAARGSAAQPGAPSALQVVRLAYGSPEELQALAAALDVWHVEREAGTLVALVTAEERQWLEVQGYDLAVDEFLTASLSAVAGYPCYRTMDELYADLEDLATTHPDTVRVYTIGYSYEGRPLAVARLTNRSTAGDKPILFVMGGIHGRELITVEVVMAFAEHLAARYGLDPDVTWILDHHEVHLLVSANPDGHVRNEARAAYWRKNTHPYGVCTYYGVDLNRNHTYKWNACPNCSSGDPCAWSYRGPAPGSEPETRAIEAYVRLLFADRRGPDDSDPAPLTTPGAFLTLHAWGNEILWPWGWTSAPPPNADGLSALARKLARYNGYSAIPSWQLYYTDGTSDDWAYGTLGVAALTFEIGSSSDGMYPPCSRYDALVQPNLDGLFYAARAARAPYLQPHGPDALALAVSPAAVRSREPVTLTALINDSATGGQAIAAAEYAAGVPWWDGGATTAMAAADGALDGAIEEVMAAVDTTGWVPGRHTIWVRGRDAAGHWGPPSAAWLTVGADAAVEGRATAGGSDGPLAGVAVRLDGALGSVEVATDSAGRYVAALSSGVYTVTATSWGYTPAIMGGLSVAAGMAATADLALAPLPLGLLAGRVRDAASGRPVPAALAVDGTPVTATAAGDGTYVLPLPAGSYTATATAGGYETGTRADLAVVAGRTTRYDVYLDPVPPLLLVDDDYLGDWLWHDRDAWHRNALGALDLDYDLWPTKEWGPPSRADLAPYPTVLWLTGDARYDTLTSREQAAVQGYLEGGGALLLSGQHVARDTAPDPGTFLTSTLRTHYLGTATSAGAVTGGGPLGDLALALGGGDGAGNAYAPSALGAAEGATVAARYGDGTAAAVAVDGGDCRALVLGFGVESVATAAQREALLRAALAWLGAPVMPDGLTLRLDGPTGPVAPGDALHYGLILTNATPVTRTGVAITNAVPLHLDVASASPAASLSDGVVRWEGLSLAPGETLEVGYTAHVSESVAPGGVVVNEVYGATTEEGAARPLSGMVRTRVAPARDVSLSPSASLIYGWAGEAAAVALTVTNRGLMTDTYALSVVGGPWPAAPLDGSVALAPGERAPVTLQVVVPEGVAEGGTGIYALRVVSMADGAVEDRAVVAVRAGIVRERVWLPTLVRSPTRAGIRVD